MGQYYFPIILQKKNNGYSSQCFYSHMYGNGLKLMEHSYICNNFVETVLSQLYKKPGHLAWVGDYHEEGDIENEELDKAFRRHYKLYNKEGKHKPYNKPEEVSSFTNNKFILNHTKKVYIDMAKYCETAPKDDYDCQIHPIPLLTAVGNGRGGGDYWGSNKEDVGCWAGDLLEVVNKPPKDYIDVTEYIYFYEGR